MKIGLLLTSLGALRLSPVKLPRLGPPVACAPTGELDPKQALAELGGLVEQVKEVWTEGKSWSVEQRAERRRALVASYVRVFAPALAFSGVQLSLTLGAFVVALLSLSVSGRGYDDILGLADGLPPVRDALGSIDSSWGNAAIALLLVELAAPLLIPVAATLTPAATGKLRAQLGEWNLDEDGLNARIEAVLDRTS